MRERGREGGSFCTGLYRDTNSGGGGVWKDACRCL